MRPERKIAIVCSGGGMRCAYTGGALIALAREFQMTSPDIIIASSGSAGMAFYYLTGQYQALKDICVELLSTPQFISFLRFWKIIDIDYLIDEVFQKQRPLRVEALRMTNYFIPITEVPAGSTRYVSSKDNIEPLELLRATKALPILFGKTVKLHGKNYVDGAVVMTLRDNVRRANELGASHVIVIDTSTNSRTFDLVKAFFLRLYFPKLKTTLPPQEKFSAPLITIQNKKNPAGLLTRKREILEKIFQMGYDDIAQNAELKKLLCPPTQKQPLE